MSLCVVYAGEDRTVQVWKVSALSPDCLSPLHTVYCGLVPVRLATLGPLLAVALQEPHSAPYCLLQIHLPTLSSSHPAPSQEHQDSITGLCACPQLGVLASSGRDGTIHIWADENHLLRILQLNAEPESLSYCDHTGDLLLGIRGDLYRIPKTHLLPPDLHTQLLCVELFDPVVDDPVSEMTDGSFQSISGVNTCVENESHAPADKGTDPEYSRALQARNRDLQDLQQGAVLCNKKQKPLATRRMKKEAFSRYLRLVFREPRRIEIPRETEDPFGPQWVLCPPGRPSELGSPTPHGVRLSNTAAKRCPLGCVPNSVALAQLWPDKMLENAVPQRPWALTEGLSMLSEAGGHDDDDDDGDEGDDAELKLQQLLEKRFTPPRQATPPPPSPPPVVENVRPRIRRLLSSLSPESFALLLLQNLRHCQPGSRKHILNALLQLLQQGALMNRKQVLIHLIELLRSFATSDMSKGDKDFVCELLRAVVSVSSDSTDTVVLLLTIVAQRDLGLQSVVLGLLKLMGLDEADPWLSSEVASWHAGTPGEPEGTCTHLAQVAARWLDFWTCKYENRAQVLKGTEKQRLFTAVDVLKFFCSVQRENQNRSPPPPPPSGRKDTVLRPHLSLRKPVLRLGETHTGPEPARDRG
ncbi:hypothetical protein GJAV_G00068910 [Gymnothorax javanicus]|nr:hypothetical protein GJAV_G00068910 [Gymnothorax javanicus]